MRSYDTDFQSYRREWLHRLSNMDPDDIICELGIETDTLIDRLWFEIEEFIQKEYEYYGDDEDNEGEVEEGV